MSGSLDPCASDRTWYRHRAVIDSRCRRLQSHGRCSASVQKNIASEGICASKIASPRNDSTTNNHDTALPTDQYFTHSNVATETQTAGLPGSYPLVLAPPLVLTASVNDRFTTVAILARSSYGSTTCAPCCQSCDGITRSFFVIWLLARLHA